MSTLATVKEVLGREGVLARRLGGFRERPQQVQMAEAVAAAFADRKHLLVEAPTGVGKSLAYLVPAILGPVAERKKVVIATHTIALQDQLLDKDLPLLAACLPIEFVAQKAIGRSNYLGLRRLRMALDRAPGLVAEDLEVMALRRLAAWAETTDEGRRQELSPQPPPGVWDLVQSEADNCLGKRCATYDACFFQRARKRLHTADIIVTNHALYFIDLMLRQHDLAVLPDHEVVVFDEAHAIEPVAADQFGLEVSKSQLLLFLGRIAGRSGTSGLLQRLGLSRDHEAFEAVEGVRQATIETFDRVRAWFEERPGNNGRIRGSFIDDVLSETVERLGDTLADLAQRADGEEAQTEISAFAGRADHLTTMARKLFALDDPKLVYFVEDALGRNPKIVGRPLDIGTLLESELFGRVKSAILASATLATAPGEGGLEYPATRLGAAAARRLVLDTPFDYERQARVHVPAALPLPEEKEFEPKAAEAIRAYVEASGGGAFLLFTSFRTLDAFHARLSKGFQDRGLLVLKQGADADRAEMLRRFRENGNAVLFGADSFWQGVDVPGSALRLLVIVKLPFPVPTLPYHEARAEEIERKGGRAFPDYFLPEALIRWRQGFGRLIRTEDDEGLVVCLDRRIVTKSYGKRFRTAIPACPWNTQAVPGVFS